MEIKNGVLVKVEEHDIINGTFQIPEGVKRIGNAAFLGCRNLKNIKIPETVTSIGVSAFERCINLISVEIPNEVTVIEGSAFFGCKNLVSINIPPKVISIGNDAFVDCQLLRNIKIPESVTQIGMGAFDGCDSLEYIEIPQNITKIERRTFAGCSVLMEVKIPEGVTQIGDGAFHSCHSLKSIEIPKTVTIIQEGAFKKCYSLKNIEIPEGVTHIDKNCFEECESLISVKLPNGIRSIGANAFKYCSELAELDIPKSVTNIRPSAFIGVNPNIKLNLPPNMSERLREGVYTIGAIPIEKRYEILFGKDLKRIYEIKEKDNFKQASDYSEKLMDIFYFRMLNAIGIEEIERIVEIPNLTAEEIKRYSLEKDEAFQELYDTKYKIAGDLRITLKLLKQLQLGKSDKDSSEKNSQEMRVFRNLNQKLEEGYDGNLVELISIIVREEQIDVGIDFIEKIRELEKSANKGLVKGHLEELGPQIEQSLDMIVPMQVEPIKAMIEDTMINIFKENGNIDLETLKTKLAQKLQSAGAEYIIQRSEQIVDSVLKLFENDEFSNRINHSCMDAIKETKESIGGAWKYKINQYLKQLGYTFDNLPETFSNEEIEKLQELLENQLNIQTIPIAVPKEGIERDKAYKVLERRGLPEIITYKQIHDMFGGVKGPYSENFKTFFKKHRKEFLENPKYYHKFAQIHNNFETIINTPELKNIYKKGELTLDAILGYLQELTFANQRPGDEELAKLAKSVGQISTEKQFEYVQQIFDITRKRERTTIPPVTVTKSKYRGRMLSPDDVLNLFAGNITTCCQKFGDIGEGSMLLGSIEENAGIFVVEELDEDGRVKNIVGQSLTIRQKGKDGAYDRLTFDNIEINDDSLKNMSLEDQAQILEIYQQAANQAIEKDKRFLGKLLKQGKITQEQYDRLVLKEVIAGTGYNDLDGLKELEKAEIVVPDEAYLDYTSMNGMNIYPWIDSAGGKTPEGSKDGISVILATMDKTELAQIKERNNGKLDKKVKTTDVPLWYGKVGKVQNLSRNQIDEEVVEQIKQIERTVYRPSQQIMNDNYARDLDDIEEIYDIEIEQIKIGSNRDWYLIYGEDEQKIMITDFAVIGGLHSENNCDEEYSPKGNSKLAIAEASNELYELLIQAAEQGKKVSCNATADTSLVNVTRMLRKGLIEVKTIEGKDVQYVKDKGLVYADNGESVETRNWDDDGKIQMLDLEIIPNQEKLIEAKKKTEELLQRAQEMARMSGTEKEEGLDEMKRQIRKEINTNDDR